MKKSILKLFVFHTIMVAITIFLLMLALNFTRQFWQTGKDAQCFAAAAFLNLSATFFAAHWVLTSRINKQP